MGRYVLLCPLGRGGMGVVYKAYDPRLDRAVALKLVRVTRRARRDRDSRDRLAREAQAIARVAHPNVVGVHDVGVAGDVVFIAMEFVDGQTLRDWQRRSAPTWRDIVRMYVQAGRGLAAAHAAGLVHRDFKPENVLVGRDGRARVVDFGLVRAASDDVVTPPQTAGEPVLPEGAALVTPLTRAGDIVGTPGYMAPEQYRGGAIDDKTDQFSFCVALYEALHDRKPFEGRSVAELSDQVMAGAISAERGSRPVPARLRAVVLRGLASEPGDRHASMSALLAALETLVTGRSRARLAVVVAAVGLSIGAVAITTTRARAPDRPCQGAARKLVGVWDAGLRGQVRAALQASGREEAGPAWKRVERDLDRYAGAWRAQHRQVCEATRVHGEQSEQALDLRMGCMQRQLGELRELVRVLASGGVEPARAVIAAGRLPDLSECDDVRALASVTAAPVAVEARARVLATDALIARAKALGDAGAIAEAGEVADRAVSEAEALAHPPLSARAYFEQGVVRRLRGDGAGARAAAFRSLLAAEQAGDDVLRARAAAALVFAVGYLDADPEAGLAFGELSEAILARVGGRPTIEAELRGNLGAVHHQRHAYREAAEAYADSLALREALYGSDSFELVAALNNLGSALTDLDRVDEARVHLMRAARLVEELFGPRHPHLAAVLVNLGFAAGEVEELDAAAGYFERALGIFEAVYGRDHPMLASALVNLGDTRQRLGQHGIADAHLARALAIREAAHGRMHPSVASVLLARGHALLAAGDSRAAEAAFGRALAIWTEAHGESHADVARALEALATLHRAQRRPDAEAALLARALEVRRRALGPEHESLAKTAERLAVLRGEPARQ